MSTTDPNKYDAYLNLPLTADNIDLYIIRTSILNALKSNMSSFNGRILDVGAGHQPYRSLIESDSNITQYVPLDLHDNKHYKDAEFTWDGITMPFDGNSFDSAMATEVLEHCPDPTTTLKEVSRVLKPGGTFFFTVPFIWPLHDCPYDEYRYTPWSLQRHLTAAGFQDIKVWPTGGWDTAVAQAMGLWARRRPMSKRQRKWASRILLPVIKFLIRKDKPIAQFNNKFYLMPGIAGTARAV